VSIQKTLASAILLKEIKDLARRITMPQKTRLWTIQRHFLANAEGWSRWDQAYQSLLIWTNACPELADEQEKTNENGHLCTSVEPTTNSEPDDRATNRAITDPLSDSGMALARSAGVS
jgi:hypothetical protein